MTRRVLLATLAALAALTPAADAATVYRPKAKRLVSSASVSAGPVLAGGRIAWIGYGDGATNVYMRSRSRLTAVPIPSRSRATYLEAYDLDASPGQIGYVVVEEELEQRDAYPVDYYFGGVAPGERSVTPFANCTVIDGCTYKNGGVEVTGNYVAYGPFTPRGEVAPQALVVTDRRTRTSQVVTLPEAVPYYEEFKMAGRFIAYRVQDTDSTTPTILLYDWRKGEEVRRVRPRGGYPGAFDVDAAGRIAVLMSTDKRPGRYGIYDSKGRLRTFSRRGSQYAAPIWIAGGRVALKRVDDDDREAVVVTDLRGRTLASMRPPVRTLTSFDGNCLAWRSDRGLRGRALYVARAARKVPRNAVCR